MAEARKTEGAGSAPDLPTTSYSVLGLLAVAGESSGYDLLKAAQGSVGFFWSPAKSHLYSELRRLEDLGYAESREVEQRGVPDKRLYRITGGGEAALREWLERGDVEPDVVRVGFLVKVFFGARMSREGLLAQIAGYRERAAAELATYLGIERDMRSYGIDDEETFHQYLTLRAGLVHARARVRWADDVTKLIEEREGR
ncbi:MAG: PadR family transcriptional regulator [Actinobacteria bacterium]|nr:PadR family transcriptional regulator [Actinomycetota bacterium]